MYQESSLRKDPQKCLTNIARCTGDYGVGQVRKAVWDQAKGMSFDREKLMNDYAYGVAATAKILNHYKTRYGQKDATWYARYHSATKVHKEGYVVRLNKGINKINRYLFMIGFNQNAPQIKTAVAEAY